MPKIVDHELRRQELAQVVLDLACREGFENVSIRSVADAAGWSRGVVAHYFKDRDDLLLFTYREALKRTMADIQADRAIDDPVDRLVACILRVLPGRGNQSAYHAIFLALLSRAIHNPAVARSVRTETLAYSSFVREALEQAVTAGLVHPPVSIQEATDVLVACADGLGFHVVLDPADWNLDEVERRLRTVIASWADTPSSFLHV